ncbi:MAG: SRPBCC domain-containing protein [Gemmatimonadaceae bacterium]
MTTAGMSAIEQPSDREVVFSRVFDAPRELLWKAWSAPTHLHRWFGPAGYTTTTHEFAFEPGGVWRFVMHGPDGTDTPNTIVFREIVPPSRLVYENSWERPGLRLAFTVAVSFVAEGAGTRLSLHFFFADAEALRIATERYGVREGGVQTLERFGEHLRSSSAANL